MIRAFWREETSQSQRDESTEPPKWLVPRPAWAACVSPHAETHARRKHEFRQEQQARHNIFGTVDLRPNCLSGTDLATSADGATN